MRSTPLSHGNVRGANILYDEILIAHPAEGHAIASQPEPACCLESEVTGLRAVLPAIELHIVCVALASQGEIVPRLGAGPFGETN
jgi:hypothetical protein